VPGRIRPLIQGFYSARQEVTSATEPTAAALDWWPAGWERLDAMAELASICVYCGSGSGAKPAYQEAARVLGKAMAQAGIRLVYGGGSVGLMGTVARAVLDAGGSVTGIIPRFLMNREGLISNLTQVIVTENMHERKMRMFELADAFAALPGGVGTLEELVEQMTWAQLGQHQKPVLIANIGQFWSPLIALFDQMRREDFIRRDLDVSCIIADKAEDIVPKLKKAMAERSEAEIKKTAAVEPLNRM
jgi:uncharacterized protein (TIGR00730 family)